MTTAPVAVHKAAPGIALLARAGYAAKGIVYVVIGALAARATFGTGGGTTDQRGAIRTIGDGPFGTVERPGDSPRLARVALQRYRRIRAVG